MTLAELLAKLGLVATATAAEADTAIARLSSPDPQKFVPMEQHEATVTALTAAQAEIQVGKDAAHLARCTALVEDAVKAGKVAPAAKDHFLSLAKANFDGAKAAIDVMPVLLKAGEKHHGQADDAIDTSDAAKLGAKARAYMDEQAAKGITVTAAAAVAHIQGERT